MTDEPTFAKKQVGDVRADVARTAGGERAVLVSSHDGYANGSVVRSGPGYSSSMPAASI
jgi:hypothetical protein